MARDVADPAIGAAAVPRSGGRVRALGVPDLARFLPHIVALRPCGDRLCSGTVCGQSRALARRD